MQPRHRPRKFSNTVEVSFLQGVVISLIEQRFVNDKQSFPNMGLDNDLIAKYLTEYLDTHLEMLEVIGLELLDAAVDGRMLTGVNITFTGNSAKVWFGDSRHIDIEEDPF